MIPLAVAQFAPGADRDANLRDITELTARAAERGARVVVLPEYSSYFVDPFDDTLVDNAEDLDGPAPGAFVAALVELAGQYDVHLVVGLLESAADGRRVRNTVVAVDRTGVLARYRKLHLYDAFGQRESDWVEAGALARPETFDVDGARFALMTCYDLRFPEVTRILADTGAHAVLVPAQWVRGPLKELHWNTLLRARAIENTLFVAAADHPPPLGVGNSAIIDPQGTQVAGVGTGRDIAVAMIDPDAVARVRRTNPALELRRFAVVPRSEGGGEPS